MSAPRLRFTARAATHRASPDNRHDLLVTCTDAILDGVAVEAFDVIVPYERRLRYMAARMPDAVGTMIALTDGGSPRPVITHFLDAAPILRREAEEARIAGTAAA